MTSLLSIRDSILEFVKKRELFVKPVIKFIWGLFLYWALSQLFNYSDVLGSGMVILVLAVIAAFTPMGLTLFLSGVVSCLQIATVSLEAAGVYLGMFLIMYLLYIKFFPKTAIIIMLTPVLYVFHLHYIIPLVVGIFLGPIGIIPVAFGVFIYYFSTYVAGFANIMATAGDEEISASAFTYLVNGLTKDKNLLLTIVVFSVVILVTYIIYRLSIQYAWYIAIAVGGILSIMLFLIGGVVLEANTNIAVIFLGTLVGVLLTLVIQFFKGTVDYSRTENVQFEDDDYYYYVKAVPKLTMTQKNVNITKINARKHKKEE